MTLFNVSYIVDVEMFDLKISRSGTVPVWGVDENDVRNQMESELDLEGVTITKIEPFPMQTRILLDMGKGIKLEYAK